MKIVSASETNGTITATVQFGDGLEQTVNLPSWATRENIRKEARRLRDEAESRERTRTSRTDLMDK